MVGWTQEFMDVLMGEWMQEWMDSEMDGWMNGQTYRSNSW